MSNQPFRKRKSKFPGEIKGSGKGIEFCNDCPFLRMKSTATECIPNGYIFNGIKDLEKIPVPDWCGNKKNET